MTDKKEVVNLEPKKKPTLEERLKGVSEDLLKVKSQIQQVEQQLVQNQRQLQARKDALLSAGLELQGQEKILKDILGIEDKPVTPPVVLAEAPKAEAKKEEVKKEVAATPAPAAPAPEAVK